MTFFKWHTIVEKVKIPKVDSWKKLKRLINVWQHYSRKEKREKNRISSKGGVFITLCQYQKVK